ncbi:hypothetical protein [Nocardia ninae]|uniref:Uncharacterized protein n=1 Tax=Nocardia ninae NBRC 108245 TaxID=1210091 RepID=A0A511MNK9_9NOCA|nr:hypothetical protein [Nocardia ninae]GEM42193.1 hypothetical protein NN4_67120 [Nocardia ninae NBRC 108245]
MTVTNPVEQPPHPSENPRPPANDQDKKSRRVFFAAAIGAFGGRTIADLGTDARRTWGPKLKDWFESWFQ